MMPGLESGPSHPRILLFLTSMPYFILCLLFAAALASPVDFRDSQIILEADYGNVNLTTLGEALVGWHDPRMNGGRFLDVSDDPQNDNEKLNQGWCQYTNETFGEPLNVIISALSDPFIMTDEGFRLYTKYAVVNGSTPLLMPS